MGKTIEISGIIEYVKVTENWEETFGSFYNMWWEIFMCNSEELKSKNVQYKIYKVNTFAFFTDEENKKYNSIKKDKDKMSEMEPVLEKFEGQRVLNPKALKMDNEIAIFDSDLLRLVRDKSSNDKLVKEIIYIRIYHKKILRQILESGFICEDKEYVFFTSSAGQVRNETITCIRKDLYDKYRSNLMNSLTEAGINNSDQKGVNLGKLMAYNSLCMSSSVEVDIDIDRVIVVPDFETKVIKEVEYIDKETLKSKIKTMDVPVNHCDGAGMFLPGTLETSCQIRCRWIKGALFPFDFKKFSLNEAGRTDVIDIYEKSHDIIKENIQIILSQSQFKMWKYYKDWDEYKDAFKKNNLKFSITNESNPSKNKTELTYQFLQTLGMTDKNVELLCQDTIEKIKRMHDDTEEMKRALGATEDNEDMEPLQEAITLYQELLLDYHVKEQIKTVVQSYRRKAMGGRVLANGFYAYLCPDLYAYCQRIFQRIEEPEGLIPDGYVYNSYYNYKKEEQCDLLRSPHLYNEHCIRNLIKTEECQKWFSGHDTIVSCHDLTLLTLMADVDGDTAMVCTSEPLLSSVKESKPLYYEMYKAEPQLINTENIYNTLERGFDNNFIGVISNAITKSWNADCDVDLDLIKKLQMYNNFTIDYPKAGTNIDLDEETNAKFITLKDLPHPYFFQYVKNKNNVQPVNNAVVNRVSKYIKENTNNLRYKPFQNKEKKVFNYAMLSSNIGEVSRKSVGYKKLQQELFKWDRKLKKLTKAYKEADWKDDEDKEFEGKFSVIYQYCREELSKIYNGDTTKLVDAFIDIEYCQPYNQKTKKTLLWNVFGDVILENIKKNLKSDAKIKSRARIAYSKEEKENYQNNKQRIKELDTPHSAVISEHDLIELSEFKKKNDGDRKIYYVLICLCKAYGNKLSVSKNKKGKINGNKIQKVAGVKTFSAAIIRLMNRGLITILEEKNRKVISLVNLHNDNIKFTVENVWKPFFYLDKYNKKPVAKCKICGGEFIKEGNTVTCSTSCAKENARRNKKKSYEKLKK